MALLASFFGMGLFGASGMFCWVIWLVIWLLVGIWVYRDAESRGASGILWLLVVIVLGIIGLILYLILRPKGGGVPPLG